MVKPKHDRESVHESAEAVSTATARAAGIEPIRRHWCAQPPRSMVAFEGTASSERLEAIARNRDAWANGTVLAYWFYDGSAGKDEWVGIEDDRKVVRQAFGLWKDLGIGIDFKEVTRAKDATIRIGFDQTDGSWSYVGRDNLHYRSPDERTMNFGWPLGDRYGHDTALHEIGHAIGLQHEHQNPNAGIVWNRDRVMENFSGPPNNWSPSQIQTNILDKITARPLIGSEWDRNSVMHYAFDAGLIDMPAEYRTAPLVPAGGLSDLDILWIRRIYPAAAAAELPELKAHRSQLVAAAYPAQADFLIRPEVTKSYDLQLFGDGDAVMVLDEVGADGASAYLAGEDDTGRDANAHMTARLEEGKTYRLRVKVHYVAKPDELSVMLW